MQEYKEKLYEVYDKLISGDSIKRNQGCDEAITLINELDNEEAKNDIRRMTVQHLIDLGRFLEAKEFIARMISSEDFYYRMAGHIANITYCEKTDNSKLKEAILSSIECAEMSGDRIDIAISTFEYAKFLYITGLNDECIEKLSNVITIAQELNNVIIEQDAMYYTALALDKKGQKNMALELLRTVSDKAEEIRNQNTAMFSEIKRAKILNEMGRTEECLNIISQWCDNFETLK